MQPDRILTAIQAGLLAFLLSFGGCACLVTAFALTPVNMVGLAFFCALTAAVLAAAFSFRYLPLAVLGAAALYSVRLWRHGNLSYGAEAILRRVSTVYHNAYGWGIVSWSGESLSGVDMTSVLCALGFLISFVAVWTVCRGKRVIPAVILSALPLLSCLVVTDILPNTASLYILLLGILILILSQTVRRLNPAHGNWLAALVAVPVALGLLLLFLCIPREGYQMPESVDRLFSRIENITTRHEGGDTESTTGTGSSSGSTDGVAAGSSGFDVARITTVALDQVGVRLTSQTPVMDVTAEVSGVLYLRGQAYNTYQGLTWQSSYQVESISWPDASILVPAGELTVTMRAVHQNIYLPYYAEGQNTSTIRQSSGNSDKALSFQYSYMVLPDNYADLELGYLDGGLGIVIRLPETTRLWAEALLEDILQERTSTIQVANDIAAYVRSSARYSTTPGRMPDDREDFAQWFLEESDTGYCIHFATAATVLLRAAGIPARYVTGYMVNTTAGQTTVVREENAHAWVEYWVLGIGWIVLEATPASGQTQNPTTPTESSTTPSSSQATQPEVSTNPTQQTTAPTQSSDPSLGLGGGSEGALLDLSWLKPILKTLGWIFLCLGALIGQWWLRLQLRRSRLARGTINIQALARWRHAVYLTRLLNERPDPSLHTLAQKAKFSQYTLTQDELKAFDDCIRDTLSRLRQKPLILQFVYRLVLALY